MQAALATAADTLQHKIKARTARVDIVGLGCVGLPLAVEFAKGGFSVTGIDVLFRRISRRREIPGDNGLFRR
jgi:UDP-N-acetyl-D-mannosaminuronate dehydrogenase